MKNNTTILSVSDLIVDFPVFGGILQKEIDQVHAVKKVSFELYKGETLGIVGESGSGKSTLGNAILNVLRLTAPDVKISGKISLNIDDNQIEIGNLSRSDSKPFRKHIQMIFQDPYESLNPRWTIKDIILEPLNIHNIGTLNDREEAVKEILTTVGLTPPENYMPRYPHELSGGQRQRVSIARTLVMKPKFVVCDEPTSMLDVSIRISIMDLMLNLAKDLEVSYLYITHDLAVARYMCNRIAVMFNGKIVEIAETEELLKNPIHPYTKRLISSIPVPDPQYQRQEYELDYDELDEIIKNNPDDDMVDIGGNHFIATHNVKDSLY